MFEFDWAFLFYLSPLPLLIYWLFPSAKQTGSAILVPFFQQNISDTHLKVRVLNSFKPWLLFLIWLLLLTAASRPIFVGDLVKLPLEGKDVILAVDLSGSMKERDFSYAGRRLNRLEVVKIAANEFINKRKKDRIGLVVFGTEAYLYAPLTFDTNLIKQFLKESQIRMAGEKTAIGDSIAMSIKHFREVNKDSKKQKILILLTDGANSAGHISPNKAIELAKLENLKIYTIGLGSNQRRGWFSRGSIDEGLLKRIASQTGGQYFRATNTQNLKQIYTALDKLETSKEKNKSYRPKKDLFFYPLSAFFTLSLILLLLRFRKND